MPRSRTNEKMKTTAIAIQKSGLENRTNRSRGFGLVSAHVSGAAATCRSKATDMALKEAPGANAIVSCATGAWNKELYLTQLKRIHCGRSEEHTSELQSLRHLVCR